jgi:hypothetical protein
MVFGAAAAAPAGISFWRDAGVTADILLILLLGI